MVKVTLERLECDVCREDGERYTLAYPDGMKILDRCQKHAKRLLAMKDEPGEWQGITPSKRGRITVHSLEEINQLKKA